MWRTCCGRTHPNLTKPVLWRAGKSFVRLVGKLDTEAAETGMWEVFVKMLGRRSPATGCSH